MNNDRRGRKINWSSLVSLLIFVMVVAGGPIINALRHSLSGVVALPANLSGLIIFGLVALSIVFSVVRGIGGATRRRGDTRLPTAPSVPADSANRPMPPFAGPAAPPVWQPPVDRAPQPAAPAQAPTQTPTSPQFEPLINRRVIMLAVAAIVVLAVLTVLAFVLLWGVL